VRGAAVWALSRLVSTSRLRASPPRASPTRLIRSSETNGRKRSRRDVVPAMSTLLCLGLGYTARHYVAAFGARFDRVIGTARTRDRADRMHSVGTVETLVFEGRAVGALQMRLPRAMPCSLGTSDRAADPVLAECFDLLAARQG